MEKNLVINIGLNVGTTEPLDQGFKTIENLHKYFGFGVHDFNLEKGQWRGLF